MLQQDLDPGMVQVQLMHRNIHTHEHIFMSVCRYMWTYMCPFQHECAGLLKHGHDMCLCLTVNGRQSWCTLADMLTCQSAVHSGSVSSVTAACSVLSGRAACKLCSGYLSAGMQPWQVIGMCYDHTNCLHIWQGRFVCKPGPVMYHDTPKVYKLISPALLHLLLWQQRILTMNIASAVCFFAVASQRWQFSTMQVHAI